MNAQLAPPEAAAAPAQEDLARAEFYALISRLFYAGPDTELLTALAGADEIVAAGANSALAQAWAGLVAAAGAMDAQAAQAEYDSVFVGTGKAEITPYASHYLADSMKENVLVRLRTELAEQGLAKHRSAGEYEDHFCALCEVMRYLIATGTDDAALQKQQYFLFNFICPWYSEFCAAAENSPNTNFYKHAARFAKAFLDVEVESFEIGR